MFNSFHHCGHQAEESGQKQLTSSAYNRWSRIWNLARYTNGAIYGWTKAVTGKSWQKSSDEIVTLVRAAGFSEVEVKPVAYWNKTFVIVAE